MLINQHVAIHGATIDLGTVSSLAQAVTTYSTVLLYLNLLWYARRLELMISDIEAGDDGRYSPHLVTAGLRLAMLASLPRVEDASKRSLANKAQHVKFSIYIKSLRLCLIILDHLERQEEEQVESASLRRTLHRGINRVLNL